MKTHNVLTHLWDNNFSELKFSGYGYYDIRTRPVNMRVSKILIPADSGYPFLISIFYPLRILSADTRGYGFFGHP